MSAVPLIPCVKALQDAFDRGADEAELDRLFEDVFSDYIRASRSGREALRAAVAARRGDPPGRGSTWRPYYARFRDERRLPDLRRALMLASMLDAGNDGRDAICVVDDLVYWARANDLDPAPLLLEVAAVSSRKPMHGMTSMRRLLRTRARTSPWGKLLAYLGL
jgi:hypothetical protein